MSNQDITQPATTEPYVLPTIDDVMSPLPKSPGKQSAAAVKYGEARKRVGKMIDTANGKLEEAQDARADALRGLNSSYEQNAKLSQRVSDLRREADAAQAVAARLAELWPARAVVLSEIGFFTGYAPEALPSTGEPLVSSFQDELGLHYCFSDGTLQVGHGDCPDVERFTVRHWDLAEVLSTSDWNRLAGHLARCVGPDQLAWRRPARFMRPAVVDSAERIQALTAHLRRLLPPEYLMAEQVDGYEGLIALMEQLRRQAGI